MPIMYFKELFQKEMEALKREAGDKAEMRNYQVLVELVRWLRKEGHGNVKLSAVDHILGAKFRTDTIITVKRL